MFAQGDYCDKDSTYVTKFLDFTTDKAKLVKFVKDVKGTGGGDFEECYELVLQQARQKLSWAPGTVSSIWIMCGLGWVWVGLAIAMFFLNNVMVITQ